MIDATTRIRFRVVGTDGANHGGFLDPTRLRDCRHWVGSVRDGARDVLYQRIETDGSPSYYLLQTALHPKLEVYRDEAIDLASLARRMTPHQARQWLLEQAMEPSEALQRALGRAGQSRRAEVLSTLFVHTDLQRRILEALDGRALAKDGLRSAAGLSPNSDIYRKTQGGGLSELVGRGEVVNKRGLGYYRPDAPPPAP